MTAIELRKLFKTFGQLAVCTNVNLAVRETEFVTLLGSSGCGKTTTLNMLKGVAATTAASVMSRRALAQKKGIRVLVVADPFYYALNGVAGQFREETGVEVNLESLSYDALQARLVSSFVSGQPDADVISVDNIWLGQYLESKWIKPLNSLVKADKDVNFKDFIPGVLYSLSLWKGQLGTLPIAPYGMFFGTA